jgi:3-deoxy-manno-octulosonate cytidylyltransferase (CMP-KDO synthetase)
VRIIGIIPARYASTRFPGKPLVPIAGKPLIQRVVEQCRKATALADVIVATDDQRIFEAAATFCRVQMTRSDHPSGSDRIAEVARRLSCDAVVNIQGDEPLIDPAAIDRVARATASSPMSTAATPIGSPQEYDNPNVVKVVVNQAGHALYFSRFPFLKHLGLYGYRRETLLELVGFPVSPLEAAEKLEQLRALDHGINIAVVRVEHDSTGVDVPSDVERVEQVLRARGEA